MKKIIALGIMLQSMVAFSQVSFNPGVRAGINVAKFTNNSGGYENRFFYDGYYNSDISFSPIVDFYMGFQGNIRFNQKYALQPELNYSRQGSEIAFTNNRGQRSHERLSASYLGVYLVNKFYFNKFNIHLAPSFEVLIDRQGFSADVPLDLGFIAGLGYDINKNLGFEMRLKRGVIPVVDSGVNHHNFTVQIGAHYTFK